MAIINNIKSFFALRKIRNALSLKRKVHYTSFEQIKSVLILFESDAKERNKWIRSIIAQLEEEGKKVHAVGYAEKKDIKTPVLPHFRLFSLKDLNYIGLPSAALTRELLHSAYDIVILLSTTDIAALDYLFALAQSPFKVSKIKPYKGIADFMLALDEANDEEYLFEQILFYLKSIQAKK